MFVPYQFQSTCVFLNNELKRIDIRDAQSVDVSNNIDKIRNKFFFLLTILHDSVLFVLNKFFYYDNIDGKRSMIR